MYARCAEAMRGPFGGDSSLCWEGECDAFLQRFLPRLRAELPFSVSVFLEVQWDGGLHRITVRHTRAGHQVVVRWLSELQEAFGVDDGVVPRFVHARVRGPALLFPPPKSAREPGGDLGGDGADAEYVQMVVDAVGRVASGQHWVHEAERERVFLVGCTRPVADVARAAEGVARALGGRVLPPEAGCVVHAWVGPRHNIPVAVELDPAGGASLVTTPVQALDMDGPLVDLPPAPQPQCPTSSEPEGVATAARFWYAVGGGTDTITARVSFLVVVS